VVLNQSSKPVIAHLTLLRKEEEEANFILPHSQFSYQLRPNLSTQILNLSKINPFGPWGEHDTKFTVSY